MSVPVLDQPTYRENVTDKEQGDIERAVDDSADRFQWFKGDTGLPVGQTKSVKAYDLQAQGNDGGQSNDAHLQFNNPERQAGGVIGSHNDKPAVFATPGKA